MLPFVKHVFPGLILSLFLFSCGVGEDGLETYYSKKDVELTVNNLIYDPVVHLEYNDSIYEIRDLIIKHSTSYTDYYTPELIVIGKHHVNFRGDFDEDLAFSCGFSNYFIEESNCLREGSYDVICSDQDSYDGCFYIFEASSPLDTTWFCDGGSIFFTEYLPGLVRSTLSHSGFVNVEKCEYGKYHGTFESDYFSNGRFSQMTLNLE